MKLSVKFHDPQRRSNHQKHIEPRPLLLRAKIPITIFNLPFLSSLSTATDHRADLSFSLATNFSSGPNLKLAYTATSSSSISAAAPPFSLTLKSGIGVFGSPKNSPLIISASLSLCPQSSNPNPSFTLLLTPKFGSFSLKKATSSNPNPSYKQNGLANSFGFVSLERPTSFQDFSVEDGGKESLIKGISAMASTEMQITKKVSMNFRWGVNFPEDLGSRMPYLNLNKISIERVDGVKEEKKKKNESSWSNVELLKGMCFLMKKELDSLQRENRELKLKWEEMKVGKKIVAPVVESSSGFEHWKSKKNVGGDNGKKEAKMDMPNGNQPSDIKSELEKAISAAASSP